MGLFCCEDGESCYCAERLNGGRKGRNMYSCWFVFLTKREEKASSPPPLLLKFCFLTWKRHRRDALLYCFNSVGWARPDPWRGDFSAHSQMQQEAGARQSSWDSNPHSRLKCRCCVSLTVWQWQQIFFLVLFMRNWNLTVMKVATQS